MEECKGNIAVLFTDSISCDNKAAFSSRYWSRVHSTFSKKALEHGLRLFFAPYYEYKDGKLKRSWTYKNKKWIKVKEQEIDMIYSRFARTMFMDNKENQKAIAFKYKMAEKVTVLNHPLIDKFCWDKRIISDLFPEYTPKTFLINTTRGLRAVLPAIKSEKIVLKPRYGTLGENVIITDRNNLPEAIGKNTLVQEFIDTSAGIKDIVKGYHDLRLIIANGKIDHSHIRIPKKGLLAANVALGGKKIFIENSQIPKKAVQIAKKIDRLFKSCRPRLYSVDFLIDKNQKPYIVECNSQPMIDKYAFGKYAHLDFYDRILEVMRKGIKIKVLETLN
jgi:glutathione synthase/RimK-type ligase-like ATP-grasp enzyme